MPRNKRNKYRDPENENIKNFEIANDENIDNIPEGKEEIVQNIEEKIDNITEEIVQNIEEKIDNITEEIVQNIDENLDNIPEEIVQNIEENKPKGLVFVFDGEIKPGLYEKLLDADLDEEEEIFWVQEFSQKGLGIRLEGKKSKDYIFSEKIVRGGADFNITWDIYKKWKDFPRKF